MPGQAEAICWDADEVERGLAVVEAAREGLLQGYRDTVNAYQGVERASGEHELIGGDWLQQFSHIVYAAWRTVSAGAVRPLEPELPVIADSKAFANLATNPDFQARLESVAAALLGSAAFPPLTFPGGETLVALGAKRSWQRRVLDSALGTRRPEVLFCHPYYKCTRREWLAAMWSWRNWARQDDLEYPVTAATRHDAGWRIERASAVVPAGDFPSLVLAMMPLYMPLALLEGFTQLRNAVLALGIDRPRTVYTASSMHGHLAFKILAAAWREEGTVLASHQHGSGYGFDRIHAIEDYESRVADRFYSWGWTRADRPVVPLSPPALPALARSRGRILLNCVEYPRTVYRLHFQPMPGTMETLLAETLAYLAALLPSADLLVRPYHMDYGWKMAAAMRAAAPWAAFDDERPSQFRRFAESRLVVHNYLGTGWLETLALDVPTICFFDPKAYRFRSGVLPHIDSLERAGILHRSAAGAARFSVEVWRNPEVWWQTAEVQEARRAFVSSYANFSVDWRGAWTQELRKK
jgi:putative transferase (TIGR04331 family)